MAKQANIPLATLQQMNDEPRTALMERPAVQDAPPAAVAEPTPGQLIQAAVTAGVNGDLLQQLVALKERMENREAEKAFNRAMVACQKAMPVVVKDAMNTHTRTPFTRLEKVMKDCKKIWQNHGFSISHSEEESIRGAGYVRIRVTVSHEEGHSKDFFREGPVDDKGAKGNQSKTELHGAQSTVSYLFRKSVFAIFSITEADHDDDGNGGPSEPITDEQRAELFRLLTETKSDTDKFMAWLGVEQLADITQGRQYDKAIMAVRAKLKGGSQ